LADNTLYWHDYEATGTDPARDRPVQFAGVRTDEALNIIGEPLNIYARLAADILPHPMATLITGVTPQMTLARGLCEDEFIARIHAELSQPGTCGVGYNSLRYDDEVTRNTLYRNLYDPYVREWQNGNSRWDVIDLVRACRDLRPEGIEWPIYPETGRTSFRLEQLTAANGLGHESAHDALSDVHATIALARLIRDRQPKLYDFVYKLRRKNEVARYLDLREMTPVLHTSGMYGSDRGNTRLVMPLAAHPVNKNSIIVFDLSQNPALLLDLGWKKLRERMYAPAAELPEGVERPALKQVLMNKCPVVAPLSTLTGETAERLGIDLAACQGNRQTLLAHRKAITEKVGKVFGPQEFEPKTDPDLMLYGGGFFSDADRNRMRKVHEAAPEELGGLHWAFEDQRLEEMLFRFRARNYPATLNAEEQGRWNELRRERLVNGAGGALGFDGLAEAIAQIRQEQTLDEKQTALLGELEAYAQGLRQGLA